MIQLHPDCLIFRTSQGELIPCSAESVTIEMIGDASSLIDPETVREAPPAGEIVTPVYRALPEPLAFKTAVAASVVSPQTSIVIVPV